MDLKDKWVDKIDGVDIISANDINQVAHAVIELEKDGGAQGVDGATFIPEVSDDGVISWTNDRELPNPSPVNIKGEKGDKGDTGLAGYTPVKGTDYWTDTDKTDMLNDVLAALPTWNGGSY